MTLAALLFSCESWIFDVKVIRLRVLKIRITFVNTWATSQFNFSSFCLSLWAFLSIRMYVYINSLFFKLCVNINFQIIKKHRTSSQWEIGMRMRDKHTSQSVQSMSNEIEKKEELNGTHKKRERTESIQKELITSYVFGYWFYNELHWRLSRFNEVNWMCHIPTGAPTQSIVKHTFPFCQRVKSHFKYFRSSNNIIGKDEIWDASVIAAAAAATKRDGTAQERISLSNKESIEE